MPRKYPGDYFKPPRYHTNYRSNLNVRNSPPHSWTAEFQSDFQSYVEETRIDIGNGCHDESDVPTANRAFEAISIDTLIRFQRAQKVKRSNRKYLQAELGDNKEESFDDESNESDDGFVIIPSANPPLASAAAHQASHQRASNSRLTFAKMMLTKPPSHTPTLSHTTSIPSTVTSQQRTTLSPPAPPTLGRSVSAPGVPLSVSYTPSPPRRKPPVSRVGLPAGVFEVPLVPSRCFSTTLVLREAQAAVEVAWRSGGYLRVLPIIGVDPELSSSLEHDFQLMVAETLASDDDTGDNDMNEKTLTNANLMELTGAVMKCLVELEVVLIDCLPSLSGGRYGQGHGSSWNRSLRNAMGLVTGCKLDSLSPFDRWCESEEQEKSDIDYEGVDGTAARSGNRLGKYKVTNAQSVFGTQECVVCGDVCSNPQLGCDGESGGAALSACGHWCCVECWRGYLMCASGDGAARIGCPAYQCRASHLSRGALAHLVAAGEEGALTFSRLETFRAEKARFIRRVRRVADEEDEEGAVGRNTVSRYCPDPRCNKLLRARSVLSGAPVMLLCECGGVVCSSCGAEDGHLGLSCEEKSTHRKKWQVLENEAASLRWLKLYTKPCPKCEYPIEKSGGCLHMRCQQCQYYFCWTCMGPGGMCRSFQCCSPKKKASASTSSFDTSSLNSGLIAHRHAVMAIQQRRCLLSSLQPQEKERNVEETTKFVNPTSSENSEEDREPFATAITAQILLVKHLLWLHILIRSQFKVDKPMLLECNARKSSGNRVNPDIYACVRKLDLLLHVLSEIQLAASRRSKIPTKRQEQKGADIEAKKRRVNAAKKLVRDYSQQQQQISSIENLVSCLDETTLDEELTKLLNMSHTQIRKYITVTLRNCVKVLFRTSPYGHSSGAMMVKHKEKGGNFDNRPVKRGSSRRSEDLVARSKHFSGHKLPGGAARKGPLSSFHTASQGVPPWQVKETKHHHGELVNDDEGGEVEGDKAKIRWKGREKAKAHTQRAMKAFEWEVGVW